MIEVHWVVLVLAAVACYVGGAVSLVAALRWLRTKMQHDAPPPRSRAIREPMVREESISVVKKNADGSVKEVIQ